MKVLWVLTLWDHTSMFHAFLQFLKTVWHIFCASFKQCIMVIFEIDLIQGPGYEEKQYSRCI